MTQLDLDGVALRQHDEPYTFDYSPYAHQLELHRLVGKGEEFVAVNDSPTGGGKTSAWLAPAIDEALHTIAIYPTNALIADQYKSICGDVEQVADHKVSVLRVTSDRLHKKRKQYNVWSNGETIDQWFREEQQKNNADQIIFLTNPDIFVIMCRDLYANPSRAYKRFEFAVVDEFHRAGQKEQNTLRYLLDELYEQDTALTRLQRIAFLSATPDEDQERSFEKAMAAPYHRLTEGRNDERRSFRSNLGDGWKSVMPPVNLDVRTAPTFGTADILKGTDSEETLEFCRGGKTVVMLDGIHEVKRVSEWLDEELEGQTERIDGFHRKEKDRKLQEFDVLVSNSAVEVGIDFDVDRLLFAGHNHASFLQRLGRLRNKETTKQARCYVPRQVKQDLAEYDSESVTRKDLDGILENVYPDASQPSNFDWRYSGAEMIYHLESRLRDTASGQKEPVKKAARERIRRHFLEDAGITFAHDDLKRTKETLDWRLLTDLQQYRGDSIQALVYDQNENNLKSYNLFYLLRYGDVEFFTESEFEQIIPRDKADEISRYARYVDGFCIYNGTIETTDEGWGRDVYFSGRRLGSWISNTTDDSRQPKVLPGIKISVSCRGGQDRVESVDKVNQRLQHRAERSPGDDGGLLCYPVYGNPSFVKEQFDLGSFFFLYQVGLSNADQHSLAIGTDALYLHCHVMNQDAEDEDEFIEI